MSTFRYSSLGLAAALISASALAQDATYVYTPASANSPSRMVVHTIPETPAAAYAGVEPRAATPSDLQYLGGPQEQISAADPSVTFVTGGIGHVSQQQITSIQRAYPLKLSFADNTGHYLANVNVAIADTSGNTVLNAVTDGPILLAKLKPGTYTVNATYEGQTQTRKVSVGSSLKTSNFSFRSMESNPEL